MTPASSQSRPSQSTTPDPSGPNAVSNEEADKTIKTKKRSKISLLTSSYPLVHARMYRQTSDSATDAVRSVRGINLDHYPREMKVVPPVVKRKPQRYHFGIRSRGQGALEVMQEIYKSLERMGAEWVEKQPNPDSEDKSLPVDPFTIKCRWRKTFPRKSIRSRGALEGEDDMFVYMEIQLYQQPEPRDYLVDFKWVGYELLGEPRPQNPTTSHSESGCAGPPGEDSVHSCFPFLDIASTLINALARGGD
jgi:Adenylate sensor of SNF1-like protein kinase